MEKPDADIAASGAALRAPEDRRPEGVARSGAALRSLGAGTWIAVWLLAAAACTHDSGTIELVTDDEAGTFTQSPVPVALQIAGYASDGGAAFVVDATLPTSTIDLGNLSENTNAVVTASGFADSGQTVVYGASVPYNLGSLAGETVPIFVQRTGQFARLPGTFSDSRTAPLLALFDSDILLAAGSDQAQFSATTQLYDFTELAPFSSPPALPQPAESIAFQGTVSWLFDEDAGSYFDFSSTASGASAGAFSLPGGGGSFADIAGGDTIIDPDTGDEYVVGATRTSGDPSKYVLEIDPSDTSNSSYPYGNPTWIALATPRLGAAAVWYAAGDELVIAGGNLPGDTTGGVETIPGGTSATVSSVQSYPPDPTVGAGAVVLSGGSILLVGGVSAAADGGAESGQDGAAAPGPDGDDGSSPDAGIEPESDAEVESGSGASGGGAGLRLIGNANCPSSSCTLTPWGPSLPVVLPTAQAFTADGVSVVIVGNDPSGATHVLTATSGTITEVPTRVPHTGARAIVSPTGTVVLVGGSPTIESFTP